MALSATLRATLNDNADATSYAFPSATYSNNKLYLLFLSTSHATLTAPVASAISGAGLTFTNVAQAFYSGIGVRSVEAWRCLPTSGATTGVVTATLTGGTATNGHGFIIEIDGMDTSGSNGSGAIVQSPTAVSASNGTSGSVTLSAFGSSDNRPFSFFAHRANEVTTFETNWTELGDVNSNSPSAGSECQWRSDTTDTTATATWGTSSAWGAIAIEIKQAVAAMSFVPYAMNLTYQPLLVR